MESRAFPGAGLQMEMQAQRAFSASSCEIVLQRRLGQYFSNLNIHANPLGILLTMQILIQEVWGEMQNTACLTSPQGMLAQCAF